MSPYKTARPSKEKEKIIKEMQKNDDSKKKLIQLKIDSKLHKEFHLYAINKDMSLQALSTMIIKKFLEEENTNIKKVSNNINL